MASPATMNGLMQLIAELQRKLAEAAMKTRYHRCWDVPQLIRFLSTCEASTTTVQEILTRFRRTEDGSKPRMVFDVEYLSEKDLEEF